jgi:predicted negative regulator of RcsB-dependent stress response
MRKHQHHHHEHHFHKPNWIAIIVLSVIVFALGMYGWRVFQEETMTPQEVTTPFKQDPIEPGGESYGGP